MSHTVGEHKDGRQRAAALKPSQVDPVSFFADVLRNEEAPRALRREAAKMLLPYYHPKLDGLGPLPALAEGRGNALRHSRSLIDLAAMLQRSRLQYAALHQLLR